MKRILLCLGILSCWTSSAQLVAPVTESFDNTTVPAGWNQSATTGGPWLFSGSNNSVNCPAATDHTGNSGNYAWMDQSGGDGGVILEMDTVDVGALTTAYLEFYYWMCGAGYTPPNITVVEAYDGVSSWGMVATLNYATTGWKRVGVDVSSFVYGNNRVLIRFRAESGGSGSDFFGDNAIDDVSVIDAPACPGAAGFAASNIQPTTADLVWVQSTSGTDWDVIWGAPGFDPLTAGTTVNSSGSLVSLTSLTGNTSYEAYLIPNCGATVSLDTMGPVALRTPCVAEAVGYNNGFEADAANSSPLCWTPYIQNTSANITVVTFPTPYAGSNHLRLGSGFATSTDTTMVISPELLNLSSGNNQIRFFTQADDIAEQLIVGTVSDPTDPGSFSSIDTIRYTATGSNEEIIIPISTANGYNGTHSYIAFKHSMNATFNNMFIDEFNYEVIPPCPKITAVSVVSTTDSSATFSFSSSGTAVGFEWGPVGFQQGTGTNDTIQASSPITIDGMIGNTTYDIYLRNDCSDSLNGVSVWTGPITFTTACTALTAPYYEDFESNTLGFSSGADNCWSIFGNGAHEWELRNAVQTTSGGTGAAGDNTLYPSIGGQFFNSDVSFGGSGDSSVLESPVIDISGLTTPELRYYLHRFGSNMGEFHVDIFDGTNWNYSVQSLTSLTGTQSANADPYTLYILDLTPYAGTTNLRARFRTITNGCCAGDNSLDDISFADAPTCNAPSFLSLVNRTSNSISVNWITGGTAVASNIEYGATGFTPGTGSMLVTTDTIDTISGLSPNTTYDIYVQDSCGAGNGNSLWIGPLTVTTKCLISPTSLPFFDGFESYTVGPYTGDNDFCNPTYIWEFAPQSTNGRLRFAAGTGFQKTGVQAATLDQSIFTTRETNFLTLNVDLSNYTTANGIELSFSVLATSQESDPDNRVWVRGAQADPWIEIVNLESFTTSGSYVDIDNVDIVGPLTAAGQSVGSETQIRFGQNGSAPANSITFSDGYTFDDVSLVQVTCPTPTGLSTGNVSDTAATLSWNTSNAASTYELWFGPAGFYQGTTTGGGGSRDTLTTGSITLDTLSANTCYEFLVRYICGPGDTSNWQGVQSFCTPCSPFFAPYLEDYDAQTLNVAPSCWTSLLEGAGGPFAGVTTVTFGTPNSLPNQMEIDNWTGGNTVIAYTPLLGDLDVGDKRVTFSSRQAFGTGATLIVGTSDNPNSSTNFNPIDTITLTANHLEYQINLDAANGYNGTDKFVGIRHGQQNTFQVLYVDDFVYEVIPTCPKPPTQSLFIQNIAATTLELEWDAGTAGNQNFQISYGSGITAPTQGTLSVVTGDSALVTGLTSNTNYCLWVREICGVGDTSTWTGPVCLSTLCTPFTAPYFQDFESSTLGHFDGLENCWTLFSSNQNMVTNTSGYSWELRNSVQTTSGSTTGAGGDNTLFPAIGGQFYNADVSYGSSGDSSVLMSPIIDISGLTNPELEYHYHRFGTNMGELHLDIFDGTQWIRGVNSFTSLTGTQTSHADAWSDTTVSLAAYAGTTNLQVRFRTVSNGCCPGDNGLDDIRISDPVTCNRPINLASSNSTVSGAEISWESDNGNTNGNYQVSYGLGLNNPALGTMSMVNGADSLILTSLSSSSAYCFYVRETCSAGDTSAWSGPFCFNTLCATVTAPYYQDFESSTVGYFDGTDNCWDFVSNNPGTTPSGGYSWEVRNSVQTTSAGTGPDRDHTLAPAIGGKFLTADVSGSSTIGPDSTILTSPVVDISTLTNPELKFYLHRFGSNMAEIHVDVWNGTSWDRGVLSYTALTGPQTATADPYDEENVSLLAYLNQTDLQVRFRLITNGCCAGDVAIDDVSIDNGNPCPDPTGLDTANVVCSGADLIWISSANTVSSSVEYGVTGFTPGTGTLMGNATSPLNVSLMAGTTYDFYVTDTCASDTSGAGGPFTFTTPLCPSCPDPTGLDTTNVTCTSADLLWNSGGTVIGSALIWGPAGFNPLTSGTLVASASSPEAISGLTPGTNYEFYVVNFCATDTSASVGPFAFTSASGPITAAFGETVNPATLPSQTVDFDASASVGATSYAWDFGDGNTGTGVNPSHPYTTNGIFTVKLTITGDCGIDSVSKAITTAGISLEENRLGRSLELYPNPARSTVNVSFDAESSGDARITVLDLSGRIVMEVQEANLNGKYKGSLDIRTLAKGTYMLKIESGELSVQRRIIKQ